MFSISTGCDGLPGCFLLFCYTRFLFEKVDVGLLVASLYLVEGLQLIVLLLDMWIVLF